MITALFVRWYAVSTAGFASAYDYHGTDFPAQGEVLRLERTGFDMKGRIW